MENYSKAIDDAINKIDWNIVRMFYDQLETVSSKKKVTYKAKTLTEIRRDLRNLIKFAIEGNCKEVRHDQWIISWRDDYKSGTFDLEVLFVASSASTREDLVNDVDDLDPDAVEYGVLKEMLDKNIQEEKYELASVIHKRLNKLDRILKRKSI